MAKTIDSTPVSATRTHQTQRFEIQFKPDGTLLNILAHRWLYIQNGGVDLVPPQYLGVITLTLAEFTGAQKTQLNQCLIMVEGVIDPKDAF